MNKDIIYCVAMLIIMCLIGAIGKFLTNYSTFSFIVQIFAQEMESGPELKLLYHKPNYSYHVTHQEIQ